MSNKGLRVFSEAVPCSAATHRQPLCTMLFPRSSGFDFAAIRWPDACRNALFAGARIVQRLPGAVRMCHPAPTRLYRFPAWRSCRNAPLGLGRLRGSPRTVISAVFHNASLNAHIEWRFP
ncbi:hypothetical protein Bxe_B2897 [Paraburkholderia xenovorans LB400]|uniref:Uncharacterized protein n=1 Tax=Paraburkholderia xenovorans (strain LB400) TaxID=266265 RepID=Q13S41_PARXL|nr:hypothetical protein Bxe_B2897 [Paraburkholderia xenovorans LB400]